MNNVEKSNKIKELIQILKLLLTIDDKEVINSSIESVIEQLEELDV